jgi:hypothetical protein
MQIFAGINRGQAGVLIFYPDLTRETNVESPIGKADPTGAEWPFPAFCSLIRRSNWTRLWEGDDWTDGTNAWMGRMDAAICRGLVFDGWRPKPRLELQRRICVFEQILIDFA